MPLNLVAFLSVLLSGIVYAAPSPEKPPPTRELHPRQTQVDIETSFTGYAGCDDTQKDLMEEAMKDAVTLAEAGLDYDNDELSSISAVLGFVGLGGDLLSNSYPGKAHQQVDFSKEAAIEFFGPESQNRYEQQRVFEAMYAASEAYPGWGFLDWFSNRYVYLSCNDESPNKSCAKGNVVAYFTTAVKQYGYPVVVFCEPFFKNLTSLDEAIKNVDDNPDLRQNSINLRSRATTFLHELLHINWGAAKECRGLQDDQACRDHFQRLRGENKKSYRPGMAKLLAKRNVTLAATNNDNYVYYSVSKFMQKKWGSYPKYPSAWDAGKSYQENIDYQRTEPGWPKTPNAFITDDGEEYDGGYEDSSDPPAPSTDEPVFSSDSYPDWYQPVVKTAHSDSLPDVQEPTGNSLSYNGPTNDDIVCETSDGSPSIIDCYHAWGTLKSFPQQKALLGKKDGTWWGGYVQSCALSIYYTGDWTDSCTFSLKDIDDYATGILAKCGRGDVPRIGGHADIKDSNCPGRVQIVHTAVQAPQGIP